jgi:hypothetical protein
MGLCFFSIFGYNPKKILKMKGFISVTDSYKNEIVINVNHIVSYYKSSQNLIGESIIQTTLKEWQVMEDMDKIYDLIKISVN